MGQMGPMGLENLRKRKKTNFFERSDITVITGNLITRHQLLKTMCYTFLPNYQIVLPTKLFN